MNGENTAQSNAFATKKKKRMSVERIYQKKTQLEHILLRPDTYIGSVEPMKQSMWVYDEQLSAIVSKEITYVPGLYKIFDELLGKQSFLLVLQYLFAKSIKVFHHKLVKIILYENCDWYRSTKVFKGFCSIWHSSDYTSLVL